MKIQLSSAFSLIPEGTYVFKITNVEYKEDFGKMEVTMKTEDGHTHVERFTFLKNGQPNNGALQAFSFFARTAMNDFELEEVDPNDLVGHYMECDVIHEEVESTTEPGKTRTFARLDKKRPVEAPATAPSNPSTPASDDDLSTLLANLG